MDVLEKLEETLTLDKHISTELAAEFNERIQPLLRKNNLAYLEYSYLRENHGFTMLYSDQAVAEIFTKPSSYNLGALKVSHPHIGFQTNRTLKKKTINLLKNQFGLIDFCGNSFSRLDGLEFMRIGISSENLKSQDFIYNSDFIHNLFHQLITTTEDLILQAKQHYMPMPTYSTAAKLMWKIIHQSLTKKNARRTLSLNDKQNLYYKGNYCTLNPAQLQCLMEFLSNKRVDDIAQSLKRSNRSIEKILTDIKTKLGCLNRDQLIEAALNNNLIELSGSKGWG